MIRDKRGITLASLVATIVIILIISTTVVLNLNTGEENKNYRKMCADIESLKDQTLIYYKNYGVVPKGETLIDASNIPEASEETGNFYNIDLGQFSNLTLNFGTGEDDDTYIINENSLNIYYLRGIELNGDIVHTKE